MIDNCNICKEKLTKISRSNYINKNTNHSWESDSTFHILNLEKAEVYLSFCFNCFQSTILPRFNTDLIYNDYSAEVRLKYRKIYSKRKYNKKENFEKYLFKLSTNELSRVQNITRLLSNIDIKINNKNKKYKILDYGGGSGFISKSISTIINGISNFKSISDLYELEEWNGSKSLKKIKDKYDLIILCHVLEHSHDPIKIIKKCKAMLKANGIIYCELPDERLNIIKPLYYKFGLHYHVSFYTRRSLNLIFRSLGFKFIKTKYFLNSSYQGVKMSIISCIVSKNNSLNRKNEKLPSKLYEIISFINRILFYIIKKVIQKIN